MHHTPRLSFLPSLGTAKSHEGAPQLGSTDVDRGCGPGVGEVSSASEYFSCVSSPCQLISGGKGAGLLGCTKEALRSNHEAHRSRHEAQAIQGNWR